MCSLIACTSLNSRESCAQRFQSDDIHQRYFFKALKLETSIPVRKMSVMASTLTTSILPLDGSQFELQKYLSLSLCFGAIFSRKTNFCIVYRKETEAGGTYNVSLELLQPNTDLLTFAIFSRDYSTDVVVNAANFNGFSLVVLCSCLVVMKAVKRFLS